MPLPARPAGRHVRRRLAGHVGRLAPGLRRVLVQRRRPPSAPLTRRGAAASARSRGRATGSRAASRSSGLRSRSAGRASCCCCGRRAARARAAGGSCWVGVGALAGGTLALLLLQGPYATGGGLLERSPRCCVHALDARSARRCSSRLALTAAFAVLVARALRRPDRRLVLAAGACVVGLLATWTLTDHSRTGVQTWLGVPAATAHLLAMTLWFGGLALLLTCVLVRGRTARSSPSCRGSRARAGVLRGPRRHRRLSRVASVRRARRAARDRVRAAAADQERRSCSAIIGLAALSRRAVRAGSARAPAPDGGRRGGARRGRARRDRGARQRRAGAGQLRAAVRRHGPGRSTAAGPGARRARQAGANVADIYLFQRDGRLLIPPEVERAAAARRHRRCRSSSPRPSRATTSRPACRCPTPGEWPLELTVRTSEIDEDVITVPIRIR